MYILGLIQFTFYWVCWNMIVCIFDFHILKWASKIFVLPNEQMKLKNAEPIVLLFTLSYIPSTIKFILISKDLFLCKNSICSLS